MRKLISLILIACALANAQAQNASKLPNFTQTFSPSPDRIIEAEDEQIDPYLGAVSLVYTDLVIPGPAAFDLRVQRSYRTSNNSGWRNGFLDTYTPKWLGLGWNLHFGRIIARLAKCSGAVANTNYMPILETADGSRQLVYFAQQADYAPMVTASRWGISCQSDGYRAVAPNGYIYEYSYSQLMGYTSCPDILHPENICATIAFYATKITDPLGHEMRISYDNSIPLNAQNSSRGKWGGAEAAIKTVTTNDGRSLKFDYFLSGSLLDGTVRPVLTGITASTGQAVTYEQLMIGSVDGGDVIYLRSVNTPGSRKWTYDYYTPRVMTDWRCNIQITCEAELSDHLIKKVTTPTGGFRTYVWMSTPPVKRGATAKIGWEPEDLPIGIASKTTSDGGSWAYSYTWDQGNSSVPMTMRTVVVGPTGTTTYVHREESGWNDATGTLPPPWQAGLLLSKQVADRERSTFLWLAQPISNAWSSPVGMPGSGQPWASFDTAYSPYVANSTVTRDGAVTFMNNTKLDRFGNILRTEEGQQGGHFKVTRRAYDVDVSKWLLRRQTMESVGLDGAGRDCVNFPEECPISAAP
jgi:hypothetical protein